MRECARNTLCARAQHILCMHQALCTRCVYACTTLCVCAICALFLSRRTTTVTRRPQQGGQGQEQAQQQKRHQVQEVQYDSIQDLIHLCMCVTRTHTHTHTHAHTVHACNTLCVPNNARVRATRCAARPHWFYLRLERQHSFPWGLPWGPFRDRTLTLFH